VRDSAWVMRPPTSVTSPPDGKEAGSRHGSVYGAQDVTRLNLGPPRDCGRPRAALDDHGGCGGDEREPGGNTLPRRRPTTSPSLVMRRGGRKRPVRANGPSGSSTEWEIDLSVLKGLSIAERRAEDRHGGDERIPASVSSWASPGLPRSFSRRGDTSRTWGVSAGRSGAVHSDDP